MVEFRFRVPDWVAFETIDEVMRVVGDIEIDRVADLVMKPPDQGVEGVGPWSR